MPTAKADQSKSGANKRKKRQTNSNPARQIKPTNRNSAGQLAAMRTFPDFNCGQFQSSDKNLPYPLDASGSSKLFYSTPTKVSHLQSSNLLDSTCSSIYSSSSSTSVNSNVHDNNNLIMLAHYAVKELEKYERPSTATSSN